MITLCTCRADDLIPEESDTVLLALKRLPPKEAYDRVFRLRRAFQVGSSTDTWQLRSQQALMVYSARFHINYFRKISKQRLTRLVAGSSQIIKCMLTARIGLSIFESYHCGDRGRVQGAWRLGVHGHYQKKGREASSRGFASLMASPSHIFVPTGVPCMRFGGCISKMAPEIFERV